VTEPARLDARDMLCDQAVLAAMRAIRALPPAGRLEVVTAAESVRRDLRAWADRLGHPREPERDGTATGEVVLTIRKRERG
jgi:TusA-related sulfurtransferase